MFRKALIPHLLARPCTLAQLARATGERIADLEADLPHLLRSLTHQPFVASITPAQCRKCGFVFDTRHLRKPSKCPHCRSTWLTEATLQLHPKPPSPAIRDC